VSAADDLLAAAAELRGRGVAFALATVVRAEAPTSAKPGAKALVLESGEVRGWVGGACAAPVVVNEARQALADGRPRLIALLGDGARLAPRREGVVEYPMTCHSGGTLEIYVEPYLPRPVLLLVGRGPVVDTLAALARDAGLAVTVAGEAEVAAALDGLRLTSRSSVVVATHGDGDEDALARALATEAGYVSLVASRRRAARIAESLGRRQPPPAGLERLKAPAGLDLGATTPEEIAVSILAEIVQHHRRSPSPQGEREASAAEARDPVCGMTVEVATARYRSEAGGRVAYFCCRHCQEVFETDPLAHVAGLEP